MFERDLTELFKWKESKDRKPLVLRGARQVGKTTLINQFSKYYKQYVYLNLEKPDHQNYFNGFENVADIVTAIFLKFELKQDYSNTLLFIDEIQESPKAIGLLRYFYEEIPELHVISAGSLLEFSINQVKSFPVGRVKFMYLYPLNFKAYLKALGKKKILQAIDSVPLSPTAHQVLLDYFHNYATIGGMPEVIHQFINTDNLIDLQEIYDGIWSAYKSDVKKYAKSRIEEKVIFHLISTAHNFLDERVTFQNFGNSNYKSREVGEAFRSLDDAKVIQLIYPTTEVEFPIKTDFKKKPRLQFLDTGLVNFALNIQHDLIGLNDYSEAYKGALIPHLITQEILSLNTNSFHKPHFWVREKKQSSAEVDLVIYHKGLVIPIEIKSGKTGRLRSLNQFMTQTNHHYAIRMYGGKLEITSSKTAAGEKFLLLNLPYFLGTKIYEYVSWFVENY